MNEFAKAVKFENGEIPDGRVDESEIHTSALRVVGNLPTRRYSESTTPSMSREAVEQRAAAGARKDKEISRQGKKAALGLDNPDDSHLELSAEDRVASDRAKNFIDAMISDINSFDVGAYLEKHPEKYAEAEELGFLKDEE